jgi:BASS family bile acid:Na+ symporter
MTGPEIIKLLITASILLLVFALGLRASFADATSFFREFLRPPNRLRRALIAMYVVVPIVAVVLAMAMDLATPVRAALLAMAVAPIPPVLPGKQLKFGGKTNYVFGLLVAVSLAALAMVPLCVEVLGLVFGRQASFGPDQIAKLIATTILVPLILGLVVRHFAPGFAERIAPWISRLGNVLLLAALIPVLIKAWPAVVSLVGGGTLLAIAAVVATAILAGHVLGGPDPDERSTLAIASAMRHPGIALAIATQNVPDEPRIPAAVILYVLVAAVATSLYGAWRKRHLAGSA